MKKWAMKFHGLSFYVIVKSSLFEVVQHIAADQQK